MKDNIIDQYLPTFEYLSEVYQQTKNEYVSVNKITYCSIRGLNHKSLHSCGILSEINGQYKWNGPKPQFSDAYNYYYRIRNKKNDYHQILNVVNHPENYDPHQIITALAIKGKQDEYNGKFNERNLNNNNTEVDVIHKETKKTIQPTIDFEINEKEEILMKDFFNNISQFNEAFNRIISLLGDVVNLVKENTITVENNSTSIKNIQNSISMCIAIAKTNQENLFHNTVGMHNILRELYHDVDMIPKDDPDVEKRMIRIKSSLIKFNNLIKSNNALVEKYGSKK